MQTMTPKKLQRFVSDYDYNITLEQSKEILETLENELGTFTAVDIERATDYILRRDGSVFKDYFE